MPISSQWPVVVSLPLEQASGDGRRDRLRRAAFERLDVPEAEGLEVGEIEAADRAGDVAERVRDRVGVAVLRSVREGADPDRVQHDHARAGHGAILGRAWTTLWDCSGS
jgi:hypothetical protein